MKDLIINPDIVDDPTLQERNIQKCKTEGCDGQKVVSFFHMTKEEISLIYVCKNCQEWWRMQETDPEDTPQIEDLKDLEKEGRV